MSMLSTLSLAVVDRGTGREWVDKELSKDEYSATDLTPLEQLGEWMGRVWDAIVSGALRGNSPWLILLVVIAVAAIVALIIWRVRRVGLNRTRVPLSAFDPVVTTPEPGPWRESARAAAERGDLRSAVIDQSRAIFAVLSGKHIVALDSASTATELSGTAGRELPEHARSLNRVAEAFNDLLYGHEAGDAERAAGTGGGMGTAVARADEPDLHTTYAEFLALDEQLSRLPSRHQSVVS